MPASILTSFVARTQYLNETVTTDIGKIGVEVASEIAVICALSVCTALPKWLSYFTIIMAEKQFTPTFSLFVCMMMRVCYNFVFTPAKNT